MTIRGAVEERVAFMAPARQLRLAAVEEVVTRHAAGRSIRVLDAGCGDGMLSLAFARRHPDWDLLGVDLGMPQVRAARARADAAGLHSVRFAAADLTVAVPEGGFDAVLAVECLTEIPDDRAALRVLAGAVGPGGILVAHVPERDWTPVLPSSPATWRHEVRHGYAREELAAMLEHAGLEVVSVGPTYRGTATAAQELRDRLKDRHLAVRAAAYPLMRAAVRLERRGVTWGPGRALLATARRH